MKLLAPASNPRQVKTSETFKKDGVPLCVSEEDREIVELRGAMWDEDSLCWYVPPNQALDSYTPWLPEMYLQRDGEPVLVPEPIVIYQFARSLVLAIGDELYKEFFSILRKQLGSRCQVCGQVGHGGTIWPQGRFDTILSKKILKLKNVQIVCPNCYSIRKLRYADLETHVEFKTASSEEAWSTLNHMGKINGWTVEDSINYLQDLENDAIAIKAKDNWVMDLSVLGSYGLPMIKAILPVPSQPVLPSQPKPTVYGSKAS